MKPLLPLILCTFASAWTFTWRNEANDTFTHSSHDVQPCTRIDHAKGREFDFEPDKDAYWFYLWTSDNCTGPPAGKNSPTVWRKIASKDLRSYMVEYGDSTGPLPKSTTTTTTSMPTATPSSMPTATPSSMPTATPSSSAPEKKDNGLIASGAIAGIVVAVVVALGILAAGLFYLGRRVRKRQSTPNTSPSHPQQKDASPSLPPSSSYGAEMGGSGWAPQSQVPIQSQPMLYHGESPIQKAWAELPGDSMVSELSDSRRLQELEGPDHPKLMDK
ncbi:uncharacterized protein ATNIH1004_007272 [Aspergillus tanneri]|uniref:Mid2 domain-containing protein n=1 Tax=Aspergillus tanneri TaxID=1220188 RepID=A0A5M9MFX9_9EURO|nr:uncharacterized protein ATNIH1004_007272 [Aspergillus tanneri]KAA8645851.1 hypothetical protein ATNIH1004_007272 [Aspergillus tanneri]